MAIPHQHKEHPQHILQDCHMGLAAIAGCPELDQDWHCPPLHRHASAGDADSQDAQKLMASTCCLQSHVESATYLLQSNASFASMRNKAAKICHSAPNETTASEQVQLHMMLKVNDVLPNEEAQHQCQWCPPDSLGSPP